jgi:4-hydroxybenzoate polyprenyltransferase
VDIARHLFSVSRFKFWHYLYGPFLVGSALSGAEFWSSGEFWAGLLLFTFPANLLIYGINDYFDKDTDVLNPKKGKNGTEKEILLTEQFRKITLSAVVGSALLLVGFATLVAVDTSNHTPLASMLIFLFFGIFYSAPPVRAKTKPFLDFLFNFLYVVPGVFAYTLVSDSANITDGLLSPEGIIAVFAASLWSFGMHLFSAIADIKPDSDAGLKTTAVTVGGLYSLMLVIGMWFAASVLGMYITILLFPLVVYPIAALLNIENPIKLTQRTYRYYPVLNMIIGFYIFWITVYLNYVQWNLL